MVLPGPAFPLANSSLRGLVVATNVVLHHSYNALL